MRLILSGTDVSQYQDSMKITNRACSIVAFNHSNYGSCKAISEYWFGEYVVIVKRFWSLGQIISQLQ